MTTAARQWPVRAVMDASRRSNALAKKKENNAGAPNVPAIAAKIVAAKRSRATRTLPNRTRGNSVARTRALAVARS